MSAESLAPPLYVFKPEDINYTFMIGNVAEDEMNYYAKFLADALTEEDDLEDEHLIAIKRLNL